MNELRRIWISDQFGKTREGFFHQWGTRSQTAENGSYFPLTVAVVEYLDGTVAAVEPYLIKFFPSIKK